MSDSISGPSLYFLVVAETDFETYTDPLGENVWPTDRCKVVFDSPEAFTRAAKDVAFSRDGAVIVTGDGTIQRQMIRVRSPARNEVPGVGEITYPDWMGTKRITHDRISPRRRSGPHTQSPPRYRR